VLPLWLGILLSQRAGAGAPRFSLFENGRFAVDHIAGNISVLMAAPAINLGLLIDGLLIGSIFALAAYGLALVWGVMNVKNLAQGDFIMIGGYLTWSLGNRGIDPLLGVPVAFAVLWAVGWVLYKAVVSKVITRDLFTSLLATFGIAIVIQQGLNLAFGPDTQSAQAELPTWTFAGGLITVTGTRVIGLVCAAVLAITIILFMKNSRMGQAIRATAQDARAARVLGIDTEKVYAFTFSLNAAICGAAGALVAMVWNVQPFMGTTYSIRLFVVVTAAGFGNLPGVIAAGFGMGVFEQFGGFILGVQYQQALIVLLLLVVLVVRQLQQHRVRQAVQ
jgi:branched-chain amino acid transport system permease protein